MKDMDITDELFDLYAEYNATSDRAQRKKILEKILTLDPDDIDALERLIEYKPKKERLKALEELRDKALFIVDKDCQGLEDYYYDTHNGRAIIRLLYHLIEIYENQGDIDKAYTTLLQSMNLNPGDNLGGRFHLIAYYIGQNQLDELRAFLDKSPDDYSVAVRFANAYLNHDEADKDFESLYQECPYLYALLSKELYYNKAELEASLDAIKMYRPGGYYECLMFYHLLMVYSSKEVKSKLFHMVALYRDLPRISLLERLPKATKDILYIMLGEYRRDYDALEKSCLKQGISKSEFEQTIERMRDYYLIHIQNYRGKKEFAFDEASERVIKAYLDEDYRLLDMRYRQLGYERLGD